MSNLSIRGVVITGKKRGREIGYPTANIRIPEQKSKDSEEGTYAGRVFVGNQMFKAAIFIPKTRDVAEAYILDFHNNLYGQEISLEVGEKLRENRKFKSLQELKSQIAQDVLAIRQLN